MRKHPIVFVDVERDQSTDVVTLSSEWRKSHWLLRERHDGSIMEFENFSSVKAKTRRSTPVISRWGEVRGQDEVSPAWFFQC
jgi:hypothetical protein